MKTKYHLMRVNGRARSFVVLDQNDVDVWVFPFKGAITALESYRSYLSVDELDRASRYRFNKDRDKFIVGRGSLRILLGKYLRKNPELIHFEYGRFGKPLVFDSNGQNLIYFNTSSSLDLILYAVSHTRPIGIDVEFINSFFDYNGIVDNFFSEHEKTALRDLPISLQQAAFFLYWSRKEAFVKALGIGLSVPLNQIEVIHNQEERLCSIKIANNEMNENQKRIIDLNLPSSYTGALVVDTDTNKVRYHLMDPLVVV